jgi:hypothetical protein
MEIVGTIESDTYQMRSAFYWLLAHHKNKRDDGQAEGS